jgi:hypothetical protein
VGAAMMIGEYVRSVKSVFVLLVLTWCTYI